MTEKQSTAQTHEQGEITERLQEVAEKQHESIKEKLERAEQEHKERLSTEDALEQAKELAQDTGSEEVPDTTPAERRRGPITKKQLRGSFQSQMTHAREHMSPGARIFSRLIHARPVEIASEAIGSTLARPNALLSGSIAAFITVTVLYFVAKHYGFQLSGFETIGAFVVGWTIGILYDYFSVMIRGHK